MKRVLVYVLCCAGGCGFNSHTFDGTGDDDGVDAAVGDPHLDTDGDGVTDATDNCVDAPNADQRDHDGDGRGNACDVCPHLPDTGADVDHDGVGDACDPRPTQAGDRIAFFEDFDDLTHWQPVEGGATWQLSDSLVHQTQVDGVSEIVRDTMPDLGNVFVEARLRVNAVSNTATARRSTGIVVGYHSTTDYYFCGLVAATQGALIDTGKVSPDGFGSSYFGHNYGAFDAPMPGDWTTFQVRTIQPLTLGTSISCVGHRPGVDGATQYQADQGAAGDIGLRTNGADATFDYVFVVEVPAPAPD
jgi:hypothetical protein